MLVHCVQARLRRCLPRLRFLNPQRQSQLWMPAPLGRHAHADILAEQTVVCLARRPPARSHGAVEAVGTREDAEAADEVAVVAGHRQSPSAEASARLLSQPMLKRQAVREKGLYPKSHVLSDWHPPLGELPLRPNPRGG
jgi:hypothetical protein